jgi:hypothetical protein
MRVCYGAHSMPESRNETRRAPTRVLAPSEAERARGFDVRSVGA